MEISKKEYGAYVRQITPVHRLSVNMARAFVTGGVICCLGQILSGTMEEIFSMSRENAAVWTSLELILLSGILTGLNLYQKLVRFAGAGALVPITGFANGVAASAIEFQAEGDVFGVGCKIFTIAGPVILYGVLASWALGLVYWFAGLAGMF